jgi:hypothetical protein
MDLNKMREEHRPSLPMAMNGEGKQCMSTESCVQTAACGRKNSRESAGYAVSEREEEIEGRRIRGEGRQGESRQESIE